MNPFAWKGEEVKYDRNTVMACFGRARTHKGWQAELDIKYLVAVIAFFVETLDRLEDEDVFGVDGWRDKFGVEE